MISFFVGMLIGAVITAIALCVLHSGSDGS